MLASFSAANRTELIHTTLSRRVPVDMTQHLILYLFAYAFRLTHTQSPTLTTALLVEWPMYLPTILVESMIWS
jgi:hypothetical protein